MIKAGILIDNANILIMGLSFKENCPDIRNTKIIDIISELKDYNLNVDVYDPWVSEDEALQEYGIEIHSTKPSKKYEGIIFAVAHEQFKNMQSIEIKELQSTKCVTYDLKYILNKSDATIRL